jgi:FkbM family methyltransferase
VVANRCTDATETVAKSFGDRLTLRVVRADNQAAASYARNVGAGEAVAPHLLFCDADDRVGSEWVAAMVEPLQAGRADFVGGLIQVNREGLRDWIYRWRYASFDQRCITRDALPFAVSASLAVTAEAFSDVGGFDPRFSGAGYEEADLSRRLLRSGFRIGEAPRASVTYEPRRSVRAVLSQARAYQRGGIILAAKEGSLGACPPVWQPAKQFVKSLAYQVFVKKERHPLAVYGKSRVVYYHVKEHRRWIKEHGSPPERPAKPPDFLVGVGAPIIGGLAFAADSVPAAGEDQERCSDLGYLAVVETQVSDGGVVVDIDAGIGVFTVAAARCVGERGRVVAFEPSPRARELLTVNVTRHRVAQRVDVRAERVDTVPQIAPRSTDPSASSQDVDVFPTLLRSAEAVVAAEPLEATTRAGAIGTPVDMVKLQIGAFDEERLTWAAELVGRSLKGALLLELVPADRAAARLMLDGLLALLPPDEWGLFLIDKDFGEPSDALSPLHRPPSEDSVSLPGDGASISHLLAIRQHRAEL